MNKQMKRWLAHAIFIGFTGTPLLRKDKQMTRDVFGTYIHTYKFHQAVSDEVILDLKYEARDVPQRITSKTAIDAWFEQKTKGLNNFQRAVIRKPNRYGFRSIKPWRNSSALMLIYPRI
jgi:type I restriction enzyme R subunit